MLKSADKPFIVVRGEAMRLMCEEEARVVLMRPVEKAAPDLSGPVGGSVSHMLGIGHCGVRRWWSVVWCCGQVCW